MSEKKSGWLSAEERAVLGRLLRYGLAIFGAVALTLVIVALAANLIGR